MPSSTKSLSVIHIFEQIKANIAAVDTPPLSLDSVKINKDEITKIGDEEYESGAIFARIAIDFAQSNSEFTFCLDFLNTGVVLTILNFEPLWRQYSELGETDFEVSRLITDTLTCLSNGQLSMLVTITEDDERFQAFELIYRQAKLQKYDAICTGTAFQSKRKLRGRKYTTQLFANNANIESVSLDIKKAQLLLMPDTNFDQMSNIGRKNISDLSEPLTLETFNANVDAYAQKVGDQVADKIDEKLGVHGMSFTQQVVHFAKWRHLELIFWSVLLVACESIISLSLLEMHFAVYTIVPLLVLMTIFRNKFSYGKTLYVFAPAAYIIFTLSSVVFLNNFVNNWISWVVVTFAIISFIENVPFDIYGIKKKLVFRSKH
jgi:hypothetical protein